MDLIATSLAFGLLSVIFLLGIIYRRATLDPGWRAAADDLGLAYERTSFLRSPRIRGVIGKCSVTVDVSNPRNADQIERVMTRVMVTSSAIPPDLVICSMSVWDRVTGRLFSRALRFDEGRFDRQVKVQGNAKHALAALGPDVRERLLRLTSLHGQVRRSQVTLLLRGRVRRADRLIKLVELVVSLARDLSLAEHAVPMALRERATEDPNAQVRLRSLRALVDHYPDSIETRRAVRDRLADFVPEIRVLAARKADRDGIKVAAEVFADPEVEPRVRGLALRAWAGLAPREDTALRAAIAQALASSSNLVVEAAAQIVAQREERAMRSQVRRALAEGPPAVQVAALTAIGAVGDPDDLALVVPRLSARDPDVRAAAAGAIGRLGGRDMVGRLQPLTRGLTQPARVKEVARAAVAAIQARAGGDRGQLALLDEDEGRLSEGLDGAVSLSR